MFSGLSAGFLKIAAVAVVTGGLAGGVVWAANAGGSDDSTSGIQAEASATIAVTPQSTAAPTATEQPLPTDPPATTTPQPPATDVPPATEPPTTAEQTKWPALAPPPPKPENPAVVTTETVAGGRWYRLGQCTDFYAPPGWTIRVGVGLADPGGGFINFWEDTSGSVISFVPGSLSEAGRSVLDPALGPAFDQLAATLQRSC